MQLGRLRVTLTCVMLSTLVALGTPAQQKGFDSGSGFQLAARLGMNLPVGPNASYYGLGGAMDFGASYTLPFFPIVSALAGIQYNVDALSVPSSISRLRVGAGAEARYPIGDRFSVAALLSAGYSLGFSNDATHPGSGGSAYFAGGLEAGFRLNDLLRLAGGIAYTMDAGLYGGITAYLGTSFTLGLPPKSSVGPDSRPVPLQADSLEVGAADLTNVFPVFYKYYEDHTIGTITVRNKSDKPIENLTASFYLNKYMDYPKKGATTAALAPGESVIIELPALFNDAVLTITEPTNVAAEITLAYTSEGKALEQRATKTIRILDRNAMTWDDDRRVAAFVSAKDPLVMNFARNVSGIVAGKAARAIDRNLLAAIAFHEALTLYGVTYQIDPKTPFSQFSENEASVDFLQYPRQTIENRSGDCDDLSILYCSLLESSTVDTAFITVPGHIYIAFALAMTPDEARKRFSKVDDLIFAEGRAWVPVEVTLRKGFLEVWSEGAREWRANEGRGLAALFPVSVAQRVYEPVGLPFSGASAVELPQKDRLISAYLQEVMRFVDREVLPQVSVIKEQIKKQGETAKALNSLGVLYARYGKLDDARAQFEKAMTKQKAGYLPALINLGNLYALEGTPSSKEKALDTYRKAQKVAPDNPIVLLGVARMSHELENYGEAGKSFARLKQIDPAMAEKFAYIEMRGADASRAADAAAIKEVMVWAE